MLGESVALSRYEKMCVLHVRKKLSHLQLGSQSDEYGWFGTWTACNTWDQFGIADSGAKHAATQGERYRFKGDTTDWFVPFRPLLPAANNFSWVGIGFI